MNFNYPFYSNFYKFFLIDEIFFADDPAQLHYGKCNVIGYLSSSDCVKSLTIPNVQSEYQLPDLALSLKIHVPFHPKEYINSTVQIYGEMRVIEKDYQSVSIEMLESSYSLMHKLHELQRILEIGEGIERDPTRANGMSLVTHVKLQKEINAMKEKYVPIILVDSIRHLPLAREVILENLQYRLIRQKVNSVLNKN